MAFAQVKTCGAKTRIGGRCRQPRMRNGRCRMHGGKTPTGLANPNTRTGRYSRDVPTRMLARYEAALADQELLSLHNDIALIQGMVFERLGEMQAAELSPDPAEILAKIKKIQAEWKGWDWTRMERELGNLSTTVTPCQAQQSALTEVRKLLSEKARLTGQENRRMVELQQTMTVEQAILFAQALVGIVRSHVSPLDGGNDILRSISREFGELLSRPENPGRA